MHIEKIIDFCSGAFPNRGSENPGGLTLHQPELSTPTVPSQHSTGQLNPTPTIISISDSRRMSLVQTGGVEVINKGSR